ncbi:MAG: hypothetical protein MJ041_01695 [Acidaminococcaceae bacterium]|nr:hypothetical protein [Acidaminococcaceae bacterium]
MSVFSLVRNGLAMVAGLALLEVVMDELGENDSPKAEDIKKSCPGERALEKVGQVAKDKEQQMKELTEEAKVFMEKLAKLVEPPAVKSEGKVEEEAKEDNADKGNDNADEAGEKVEEEKEGEEEKDSDK